MKKLLFLFLFVPVLASGQITSKILPSLKPPSERIALAYDANQPLNIDDECKVWLDGQDASTFTLNDNKVIQWDCKGALGADVSNDVDATRPTYDINTGRVTFTRANSTFLQSAVFGSALTQPNTIFIVYKITGVTSDNEYVFDGIGGTRSAFYYQSSAYKIRSNTVLSDGAINANDNIHTVLFNGVSTEYWINGISVVSGDAGTAALGGITLGIALDLVSLPSDVSISEVIVYNADISDVDRVKIEGYLSKKHDIPVTTD